MIELDKLIQEYQGLIRTRILMNILMSSVEAELENIRVMLGEQNSGINDDLVNSVLDEYNANSYGVIGMNTVFGEDQLNMYDQKEFSEKHDLVFHCYFNDLEPEEDEDVSE